MLQLKIQTISEDLDPETLLAQQGWFLLREVFTVLDREDTGKYKLAFKQIQRLRILDQDPFEVMGHRKVGGRVVVWMERFAPWYLANPIFRTQKVEPGMSFSEFLQQPSGFFKLSEVCKQFQEHLPYSYLVLKRGADKRVDPLNEIGIVKSDTTYLVSLPRFEAWLREELIG